NVHRAFFVEPNPIERFALEFFAARQVDFEPDNGLAARDVVDLDGIEEVSNSACCYQLADCVLRNSAGANGAGSPNQNTLDSIADNLTRDTARPAHSRSVKSSALPPMRIPPGCMHGRLEAAGQASLPSYARIWAMKSSSSSSLKSFRRESVN